ncbi:hypothetical protein GF318_05485 [Candidatus Micrarchaeota archaeon]|nr:hypothetical protein [Candidatus Micrarchaeota archaeon]
MSKTLWAKARSNRPPINHVFRPFPFRKEETSFQRGERFMRHFLENEKMEHPMDAGEMHRGYCSARAGGLGVVNVRVPFRSFLDENEGIGMDGFTYAQNVLILRDLFLCFEKDSGKATTLALDGMKELCSDRTFPTKVLMHQPHLSEILASSILVTLYKHGYAMPDYPEVIEKVFSSLKNYLPPASQLETGVSSDVPLNPDVARAFSRYVRANYSAGLFDYPYFHVRAEALLGDSLQNSFSIGLSDLVPFSEGCGIRRVTEVGDIVNGNSLVAVGTHPWEASPLDKAREIQRRGIAVCGPRGTLLVDEMEFSLFSWVSGKRLDTVGDKRIWELYGRTIRNCHERGIMLNDAAGRNAIWTGKEVVLIDFEHTVVTRKPRELTSQEREESLARVDACTFNGEWQAFLKGYKEKN